MQSREIVRTTCFSLALDLLLPSRTVGLIFVRNFLRGVIESVSRRPTFAVAPAVDAARRRGAPRPRRDAGGAVRGPVRGRPVRVAAAPAVGAAAAAAPAAARVSSGRRD